MLKLTHHAKTRSQSTSPSSFSRTQSPGFGKLSNGNSAGRADLIQLSNSAQQTQSPNPYEGIAPGSVKVKVGQWGSGNNDSLLGILHSQNFTNKEIYAKNDKGVTLLEQAARINKLKNPNVVRAGQSVVMPSKTPNKSQVSQTQSQSQADSKKAQVNQVKVGKWGQDSNGSLFGILKNQGFSRKQILNQDASGDSLLNKVARANGLKDANTVQEGATLNVPNSMEALEQMNVPELTEKETAKPSRPAATKVATIEPRPVQITKPATPEIKLPQPSEVKTPVETKPAIEVKTPTNERVTANMGLLLDGVKTKNFKKDEFQYLNALSNRYEETRAQFSKGGFSNEELKTLGKFETNYGVTYTRLYNSDDIKLTNGTPSSDNPKTQLRAKHYAEGGKVWDGLTQGTIDNEAAITTMIRQRAEARAQGGK